MLKKVLLITGKLLALIVVLFAALVYMITFHPDDIESKKVVCPAETPKAPKDIELKILSWNVQYFAGKDYVFFYDTPKGDGPDEKPSKESIAKTFDRFIEIVKDENPDFLLLQELDSNADRTYGEDQVAKVYNALGKVFPCYTSSYYWKADFVPHPRILGSVGLKLATFSKYKIKKSTRFQLPRQPDDLVTRQFQLKRAVQSALIPIKGGEKLILYNTHLDAFAQGNDTMTQQANYVLKLLQKTKSKHWVIGGDFNLLPDKAAFESLPKDQQFYYNSAGSELAPIISEYGSVPSKSDWEGPNPENFYTHYPNDPAVKGPDRIIDYLFYSKSITMQSYKVRKDDTLDISDHFPLIGNISLIP